MAYPLSGHFEWPSFPPWNVLCTKFSKSGPRNCLGSRRRHAWLQAKVRTSLDESESVVLGINEQLDSLAEQAVTNTWWIGDRSRACGASAGLGAVAG